MENEPTEKKVTLDTLAAMVSAGFSHVDERFDEVDKRFDETAKKVDARFDKVETRLDKVETRLDHIDARLANIERDVKEVIHREEFDDLMARVKYVEKKLGIESGK